MPAANNPIDSNTQEIFAEEARQREMERVTAVHAAQQQLTANAEDPQFFANMTSVAIGAYARAALDVTTTLNNEQAARDPAGVALGRRMYEQVIEIMPVPLYYVSVHSMRRRSDNNTWTSDTGFWDFLDVAMSSEIDVDALKEFMSENWWRFYTTFDAAKAVADQINANKAIGRGDTSGALEAFIEEIPHECVLFDLGGAATFSGLAAAEPTSSSFYVEHTPDRVKSCAQRVQFVRDFARLWHEMQSPLQD